MHYKTMCEETYRDVYILDGLPEYDYGNASSVNCWCKLPVWTKKQLILQLFPMYKIRSLKECSEWSLLTPALKQVLLTNVFGTKTENDHFMLLWFALHQMEAIQKLLTHYHSLFSSAPTRQNRPHKNVYCCRLCKTLNPFVHAENTLTWKFGQTSLGVIILRFTRVCIQVKHCKSQKSFFSSQKNL